MATIYNGEVDSCTLRNVFEWMLKNFLNTCHPKGIQVDLYDSFLKLEQLSDCKLIILKLPVSTGIPLLGLTY